jgi:hypothetical protein
MRCAAEGDERDHRSRPDGRHMGAGPKPSKRICSFVRRPCSLQPPHLRDGHRWADPTKPDQCRGARQASPVEGAACPAMCLDRQGACWRGRRSDHCIRAETRAGPGAAPDPGDVSLCLKCASPLQFGADGKQRQIEASQKLMCYSAAMAAHGLPIAKLRGVRAHRPCGIDVISIDEDVLADAPAVASDDPDPGACHRTAPTLTCGAPGGTVLLPLRSTTLTWRKASPPLGSWTKPKPFSGLYHFTVADTGGPGGAASKRGLLSRGAYPKFAGGE